MKARLQDGEMPWLLSDRADPEARVLADRHYNRQSIGAKHFVPPGRCVVLLAIDRKAFWVTSWPFAEYVRHAWPGAWVCSAFRNEGDTLSSDMIKRALSATRHVFGDPPELGMITFVNTDKVKRKRDPGRCYLKAGFKAVGHTKGGLVALQLLPEGMPGPSAPVSRQVPMFSAIQ
ncbi:hypothetical protein LCGC14_1424170 [marine sediment metagenome]|uniref:GNAT family N-acetyltransferase n=1 Tax=marine sediment metagenome TaxID=412755 RepID=A0A0F9KBK4_9ZZZZ